MSGKFVANIAIIAVGWTIAYFLNTPEYIHPAFNVMIGVAVGTLSTAVYGLPD